MSALHDFLGNRTEIGRGMTAVVFAWNGYAYKCFPERTPKARIERECRNQQAAWTSGLPVPRCYPSEFPNTIKTDLVPGETMADRAAALGRHAMLDDLMAWFSRIHQVQGLALRDVEEHLDRCAKRAPVYIGLRTLARIRILEVTCDCPQVPALCHMDFHPRNILYTAEGVRIIDWVNAGNGLPIWDLARTWVLLREHAPNLYQVPRINTNAWMQAGGCVWDGVALLYRGYTTQTSTRLRGTVQEKTRPPCKPVRT